MSTKTQHDLLTPVPAAGQTNDVADQTSVGGHTGQTIGDSRQTGPTVSVGSLNNLAQLYVW